MSPVVFDTSALLAFFLDEPGAANVEDALSRGGVISAANWSELAQKLIHLNVEWPAVSELIQSIGISIESVTQTDAEVAAQLWSPGLGLSLADRLCLSLGQRLGAEIYTADKAWASYAGVTQIR